MNTTPRYCTYSRNRTGINAFISDVLSIQNNLSAPEFSMVSPSPAQVMIKLERIITIQAECRKRNYYEVPLRNELRAQVEMMLRQQCMSVNGIAIGDIDILVKSGFAINK